MYMPADLSNRYHFIHRDRVSSTGHPNAGEFLGLGTLWVMWLVGAVYTTVSPLFLLDPLHGLIHIDRTKLFLVETIA